ncbi:MAG: hypothetical protein HYX96_01230 [Chloroflexi bacterium]|nr:hypothetical protein [Chloroflexota bacterium]
MLTLLDIEGPEEPYRGRQLLVSLDVTGNTGGERDQMLAEARLLYGPDCAYYWHDCRHGEGAPCLRTLAG